MQAHDHGRYPATPQRLVRNEIGGIRYNDPFQWLEQDDTVVAEWQVAQLAVTDAYLGQRPQAVAALLEQLTPSAVLQPPRRHGRFWFRGHRPAGADRMVLEVLDDVDASPRVLLDPAVLDDAAEATLMGWAPSPDGELVAYATDVGGAEVGRVRVAVTATGEQLLDAPPQPVRSLWLSWLGDGSGFLFGAVHEGEDGPRFAVFRHILGCDPVLEPESLPPNRYPFLLPQVSPDGRYAVVIGDPLAYRPLFLKDLRENGPWRPFLEDLPVAVAGEFVGDEFVAVTTQSAPRGRIVAIPLSAPTDPASWRELVPESEAVLTAATGPGQPSSLVDGDRIVLTELVDTAPRIRILDLDGTERARVPLPGHGAVTAVAHGGELTFSFSSLTRTPSVYHYDADVVTEIAPAQLIHDDLVLEFHRVDGADGTPLSYHLLAQVGLDRDTPQPAVVNAYGGWNIPLLPAYSAEHVAIAQAGALVVRPHLRGGGEYGHQWWDAGRLKHKPNTHRDLFAVVDHLIADGLVDADRVAFVGGSNGGLLAGIALTKRPELFRAVVGVVPVLDLFRLKHDPVTLAAALSDYGDPDDPDIAKVLWSYSPYHQVTPSTAYPTSLWLSGQNDPRCPAWHGRKMVAALQRATSNGAPQLLSVVGGVGHGSAMKGHQTTMTAKWVAFVLSELGLPVPTVRGESV